MSRFTPACYAAIEAHSNHMTIMILQDAFVPIPPIFEQTTKLEYDQHLAHVCHPVLIEV